MKPGFAFLEEAVDHCRALCATAADVDEGGFWIDLGRAAAGGRLDEWHRLWHMRAAELTDDPATTAAFLRGARP